MILAILGTTLNIAAAQVRKSRVVIPSAGWLLVGDLVLPDSELPAPGVLLLNRANGNRQVYETLSSQLAERGIASLRLDLRGHGESTNLGRFNPGETDSAGREIMIWQADIDIENTTRYLKTIDGIDSHRIGIVGASYSGEEMAEAGRRAGYAQAYVALSPGSFSIESIDQMDNSRVPWLFIVSRDEQFLHEIVDSVQSRTKSVEILYLPGQAHATRILESRPDMAERIAEWLSAQLFKRDN